MDIRCSAKSPQSKPIEQERCDKVGIRRLEIIAKVSKVTERSVQTGYQMLGKRFTKVSELNERGENN